MGSKLSDENQENCFMCSPVNLLLWSGITQRTTDATLTEDTKEAISSVISEKKETEDKSSKTLLDMILFLQVVGVDSVLVHKVQCLVFIT